MLHQVRSVALPDRAWSIGTCRSSRNQETPGSSLSNTWANAKVGYTRCHQMPMQTPQDLFVHKVTDIRIVEQFIIPMLEQGHHGSFATSSLSR
jgi:hypothetical protein